MHEFTLEYNDKKMSISTNLKCYHCDPEMMYYHSGKISIHEQHDEMLKYNKGIAVENAEGCVRVCNDLFCTIPLYVYRQGNSVVVTSGYDCIAKEKMTVDKVSFFETLLYDSPLYDRTIFEEIKFLPAASCIVIDKETGGYTIENYWNYDICLNSEKVTEAEAAENVWNTLCSIMQEYRDKDVLMGVSGGLDSRLSLSVLDSVMDIQKLSAFTFGHSRMVKDYQIAKDVCKKLSKPIEPIFIKLIGESYLSELDLPCKSGGDVGINHSHILWCLKNMHTEGKTLVSNYYSDAVMGFDCVPIEYEDIIENSAYYKKLKSNNLGIDEDICMAIEADIRKIADRRETSSNFSCYDEFIYMIERNPRFHMQLSYLFTEYVDVVSPYAEYSLLEMVLSLPKEYRYRKKLERLILEKKLKYGRDISSTRYSGLDQEEVSVCGKLYYNIGFSVMRAINLINVGLNQLSRGVLQIPNPYITENQLVVFNRYFRKYYREACQYLFERGYITERQREIFGERLFRTAQAQRGFILIGIKRLLSEGD